MRVVIEPDADGVSQFAAEQIAKQIRSKADCVLGLATGSTPLETYRRLITLHEDTGLDFSNVSTFNLDEYVGLTPHHPQSYHHFMWKHLFYHINVKRSQTHIPDGITSDLLGSCEAYENEIRSRGGIDLQLLGIGSDGHIGFNEPGSSLASRTRVKTLDLQTIEDNARFFEAPSEVPTMAVTMGVGTILEARTCLLIATGAHKAEAIKATIEGPVTSQITASALQLHPCAVVVLDELAASRLERREYYLRAERSQREFEARFHGQRPSARVPYVTRLLHETRQKQ